MSRTNIDIDDELVERAMRRYGVHSKRAIVDLALRRLAGEPMTRDEALEMEGSGWGRRPGDARPGRSLAVTLAAPAVLADTSAWVEHLRATGSPVHLRMRQLIADEGDLVTTDVVVMELLGGVPENRMARLRQMLVRFDHLPTHGLADSEAAAELYRQCRRNGETVRSTSDCLVAAVAVRTGAQLLHRDRDFDVLARSTSLKVAEVE